LHSALSNDNRAMRFSLDKEGGGITASTEHRKFKLVSLQDWALCFATFMAYRVHFFPAQAMPLLAYYCFIQQKATEFAFNAVVNYDEQFRLFLSLYPEHSWASPSPTLVGRFFSPASVLAKCGACLGPSHTCPVKPAYKSSPNLASTPGMTRSQSHCFRFQNGSCPTPCRLGYAHHCSICKGAHPRRDHPRAEDPQAPSTAATLGPAADAGSPAQAASSANRYPQHQSRNARH
jgi:hypothetical protein